MWVLRTTGGMSARSQLTESAAMEQADAAVYADTDGGVFGRLIDFLNRLDRAHIITSSTTPGPTRS